MNKKYAEKNIYLNDKVFSIYMAKKSNKKPSPWFNKKSSSHISAISPPWTKFSNSSFNFFSQNIITPNKDVNNAFKISKPSYNKQFSLNSYKTNAKKSLTTNNLNRLIRRVSPERMNRKNDRDFDGVPDRKDCQPNNIFRQDFMKKTTVPMIDYPKEYGKQTTLKYLTPEQFMREAQKTSSGEARNLSKEKYEERVIYKPGLESIKAGLHKEEEVVAAPHIFTRKGIPEDHEGRHRAVAAREMGYKKIPVYYLEEEPDNKPIPPPQSAFHAGNKPPSKTLMETGRVYGFTNLEEAKKWKKKHKKKKLYQFQTDKFLLDTQTYAGRGDDYEYIAGNVLEEKEIEDENGTD